MLQIFLLISATVFVADLGDKTQLTIILLTQKTKRYGHLFMGVLLGFLLVNAIAILVGSFIGHVLPLHIVKLLSGFIFIIFGLLSLRPMKVEKIKKNNIKEKSPFFTGLGLIFLSEFGDKSQIAITLFSTKYNPLFVLFSSMVGLTLISLITIYLSRMLLKNMNPQLLTKISGLVFIAIGVFFLL